MIPPVMLLSEADVERHLDLAACIAAVDDAFTRLGQGQTHAPTLSHLHAPPGEVHIKAGGVGGEDGLLTVKIGSGFFDNPAHGLPSINSVLVALSATTGMPRAIMGARTLTRRRTAAGTAVAARALSRPGPARVLIIGSGAQGADHVRALNHVLAVEQFSLWSRSADRAETLAKALELEGYPVRVAGALATEIPAGTHIVTLTPATSPFEDLTEVADNAVILAVGADSPHKRELPLELMRRAQVVVDLVDQCSRVGELHHALAEGAIISVDDIIEIGTLLTRKAPMRSTEGPVVYDATGTAVQDVAAASVVLRAITREQDQPSFDFAARQHSASVARPAR